MDSLTNYGWPGNIRELENLVERLAILKGNGIVEKNDLPEQYRVAASLSIGGAAGATAAGAGTVESFELPDDGMDFNTAVDSFENALIMQALERTGWNRNQAALLLKLNRTTLVEKIKKKGLRPPPGAEV